MNNKDVTNAFDHIARVNSTNKLSSALVEIVDANRVTTDKIKALSEKLNPIKKSFANSAFDIIRPSITSALQDTLKSASFSIAWSSADFTIPALQKIKETISSIKIPEISEERKQKLLDSYRKWGSYGWTIIPTADDLLFDTPPKDKKEADRIGRQACKDTEALFSKISNIRRIHVNDYNEAICNFRDRRYKSCALILFALIDSHLIRFQRKAETKGKDRSVGAGAVTKAKTRVGADDPENQLFCAMFYANLFTCLDQMFQKTGDFKKKLDVINRNYLDHGMLTKRVTRTDCLQLFLLYYNVLDLLDLTYLSGD